MTAFNAIRRNVSGLPPDLSLNPLTGEFIPASPTNTRIHAASGRQQQPAFAGEIDLRSRALSTPIGPIPTNRVPPVTQRQPGPLGAPFTGFSTPASATPPTGLIGAEEALFGGARGATRAVRGGAVTGRQDILTGRTGAQQELGEATQVLQQGQERGLEFLGRTTEQAVDPLQGFIDPGQRSIDLQADLSGANGPEAQAAAFEAFRQDPGTQFLEQEQERALLRSEAAIGGLGGGRVRKQLQRDAFQRAQTNIQNRIANLQGISGEGLQAAGDVGRIRSQQAVSGTELIGRGTGAQVDIQTFAADIEQATGVNLAELEQQTGINVGQILENLGSQSADVRNQAGRDLSDAIQTASTQLAGLQQDLGAGVSDINAGQIQNIGNLLINAGEAEAANQIQLSTLLSNLAVGVGTNQAQIATNVANIEATGILGQTQIVGDSLTSLAELIGEGKGFGRK